MTMYSSKRDEYNENLVILIDLLQPLLPKDICLICVDYDDLKYTAKRYSLWLRISESANRLNKKKDDEKLDYERNNIDSFDLTNTIYKSHRIYIPRDISEFLSADIGIGFLMENMDFRVSGDDVNIYFEKSILPLDMNFMIPIFGDYYTDYAKLNILPPFPYKVFLYAAWKCTWSIEHDSLIFIGPRIRPHVTPGTSMYYRIKDNDWSYSGPLPPKFICLGTLHDFLSKWLNNENFSIFGFELDGKSVEICQSCMPQIKHGLYTDTCWFSD